MAKDGTNERVETGDETETGTKDGLGLLFAAVFSFVRDKLRGKVDLNEIARVAKAVLEEMNVSQGPVTWEGAEPHTVAAARWKDNLLKPIRVVGYVSELHDPAIAAIHRSDGEVEHVETTVAKIVGLDGEALHVLDVVGRPLIEKVQASRRTGRLDEFLGFVIVLPISINPKRLDEKFGLSGHFYFHLVDIRPAGSAFDLLGATTSERESARAHLEQLRARRETPLKYIFGVLTSKLGIISLDQAQHLVDGIEVAILQAMSTGSISNTPARIHMLVVGPPGVGKKLLGLAARALNPVCHEASAAKVSAAGLVGASHRTETGWTSTPGLLPLAGHGVLIIQDAQALRGAKLAQIAPIFQEQMEDGEVRDSVAGGRKRLAPTATIIDLNRASQVTVGQGSSTEAALLGQLPFLSREDVILEAPVLPERNWTTGERMYRALRQGGAALDEQPWVRDLRLLVACLRDEHPVIDTAAVMDAMEAGHRKLREENADLIATSPVIASAIPVRLPVSVTRLVIASARANDRGYATEEDVERGLHFVRGKIGFMRGLARLDVPVSACPGGRRAADEAFWGRRQGVEVNPSTIRQDYAAEVGEDVSTKTILRELQRRGGVNVGHGRWLVPGTLDGTSGHRDTRPDVDVARTDQNVDAPSGVTTSVQAAMEAGGGVTTPPSMPPAIQEFVRRGYFHVIVADRVASILTAGDPLGAVASLEVRAERRLGKLDASGAPKLAQFMREYPAIATPQALAVLDGVELPAEVTRAYHDKMVEITGGFRLSRVKRASTE